MSDNCFIHMAHPFRIQGSIIEAHLPETKIGEICKILYSLYDQTIIGYAQVLGFNRGITILSLLCDNQGLSPKSLLLPTGEPFRVILGDNVPGAIINSTGTICGRLDKGDRASHATDTREVRGQPRDFSQRKPVNELFCTGIRAIDGLLTCGRGQRIGIFAAAGCGKTSLMNMIIEHSCADIYVVALIGERGREVTEFVNELRQSSRSAQIVVVYATSDQSCVERCNAAQIATTIAEYFSDRGKNVLLFIDSVTRYARALRDTALAMGELPARRGYPASVFEALPKLLERPGRFETGSITAFYTVLIENEEEADVIGDEVRSILDGHIYLSSKLAYQGHYPAIDILQSISRVFTNVTQDEHRKKAARFRELLVRQRDLQIYIDMGEYRRGENAENDRAFDKMSEMNAFLKQELKEGSSIEDCLVKLDACTT